MDQWYAAHLILYVEYTDRPQKSYPLWENVILIRAETEGQAFAKAERVGKRQAGRDRGELTWDGKPARWVFAGVRKLALCDDAEERPGDGTEITYTQLRVRSLDAVKKLIDGVPVGVQYIEDFRD